MKKKIISIVLSVMMCLGASMTAFAANTTANATTGTAGATATAPVTHTYEAYQIFTGSYDNARQEFTDIQFGNSVNDALIAALDKELGITAPEADSRRHAMQIAKALSSVQSNSVQAEKIAAIVAANVTDGTAVSVDQVTGYGYYLIVDTTPLTGDDAVYLDRSQLQVVLNGVVNITEKRDNITIEKKVKDINDSIEVSYSEWQDSADYDVNDEISFQLTGTLPNDYDLYSEYEYVFTDEASAGLDFKADTVVVYADTNLIDAAEYTVVADPNGHSFKVIFADLKKVKSATITKDTKLRVEYKAVLNGTNVVYGVKGNPNKARIEFDNKTGGKGKTPWDTVIVFSFKTQINKVDQNEDPLAGAEFKIEKLSATLTNGKYVVNKDADGNEVVIKTLTVTLNDAGTEFSAKGLDDGVYKITETKTPESYNSINPIYFVVVAEHDVDAADPKLTKLDVTNLDGKSIVKANNNLGTFDIDEKNQESIDTTIINQYGAVLPSTGGIGTTIFYIVGGVLVVGAVVLLIVRRKMGTTEEE
jgi:fimbrial isopeptide formation D2 family protein/LPXTG-motif cell wall-anchored protein